MTIPTEVAAVLADLKILVDSDALERVYARIESALTAKAEAVEPVAWLVTREGDPTFPKAYIREDYADLWTERNDLPPFIEKTPLYAHAPPAAPVESPCTCPSGDGSLRWPCPKHPPTESVGRAPDGLCPQCNGEKEGYLIDGDGPYLCNACEDAPPAEVAKCTNSDAWNCKYCRKTSTCAAITDPRNFGVPVPPAAPVASVLDGMIGRMLEGDFTKNTITFEMQGEYILAAGTYRITREPIPPTNQEGAAP